MSALSAPYAWPVLMRVLLADEAGFSRDALVGLLTETPGVELAGVVAEAHGVSPALARLQPDVLIIDDRLLQHLDWLPVDAGLRVIAIGVDDDPGYAARAARLGAVTWLPKERADLLVDALFDGSGAAAKYGPAPRPIADDGRARRA